MNIRRNPIFVILAVFVMLVMVLSTTACGGGGGNSGGGGGDRDRDRDRDRNDEPSNSNSGSGSGNDSSEIDYIGEADWIYSIQGYHGYIHRVRPDDTGLMQLSTVQAEIMHVVDDWIYFANGGVPETAGIYKIRHDGTEETRIYNYACAYKALTVAGDWVYFSVTDSGIFRISTDGSDSQLISSTKDVVSLAVHGGYVYYSCYTYQSVAGIGRINLTEYEKNRAANLPSPSPEMIVDADDGIYSGKIGQIKVYKNMLYYVSFDGIYKMDFNSLEVTQMVAIDRNAYAEPEYFSISDGWIFYSDQTRDGGFFKVKTDGSGSMRLIYSTSGNTEIISAGAWFYTQFRKQRNDVSVFLDDEWEDYYNSYERGDRVVLNNFYGYNFAACFCCNGNNKPVNDTGSTPPNDGGSTPPNDGGTPPPNDGGTPPPDTLRPGGNNDEPGNPVYVIVEGITIELCSDVYGTGATMTVTVKNLPREMESNRAFIAIYIKDAAHAQYQEYQYPKARSSEHTFTVPREVGDYEIRLYRQDYIYNDETFVMSVPFKVE